MSKKHKSHKQEEKEAIESGLKAIYGNDEVDFSTLERAPSRLTNILLTIVITLAVVGLGAGIAFFIYQSFFIDKVHIIFNINTKINFFIISFKFIFHI